MEQLKSLAEEWSARSTDLSEGPILWVGQAEDGLRVDYFGPAFDEAYSRLVNALASNSVLGRLRELKLRSPDEGANGTCSWDLGVLVDQAPGFPALRFLSIELTRACEHNTKIVAACYEEDGVLGRLLAKAPNLEHLTSPSAPSSTFFECGERPLRFLSVDAGYDSQDFVAQLATATNLSQLRAVEYGEGIGAGFEGLQRACFDDYASLVTSTNHELGSLHLRNPDLSQEELLRLARLRPTLQLRVVDSRARGVYGT